jgi:hypothetical protein
MNQLEFELEKHHSVIRKQLRKYGVWPDVDGKYLLHDAVWAMADNPLKIEDRIRMDALADENERLRRELERSRKKASLMSR